MNERGMIVKSMLVGLIISASFLLLLNLQSYGRQVDAHHSSPTEIAAKTCLPNQEIPSEEVRAVHQNANIPSAIHVQVVRELLCLFVLLHDVKLEYPRYEPEVPLPLSKHFITLFRAVISPNAP
jgi:hypothetical protein